MVHTSSSIGFNHQRPGPDPPTCVRYIPAPTAQRPLLPRNTLKPRRENIEILKRLNSRTLYTIHFTLHTTHFKLHTTHSILHDGSKHWEVVADHYRVIPSVRPFANLMAEAWHGSTDMRPVHSQTLILRYMAPEVWAPRNPEPPTLNPEPYTLDPQP